MPTAISDTTAAGASGFRPTISVDASPPMVAPAPNAAFK